MAETFIMGIDGEQLDWLYLDRAHSASVVPGELVSTEAGGMPIYRVMALNEGRAWLRDVRDGSERATALNTFHWKALERSPGRPLATERSSANPLGLILTVAGSLK